MRVTLFRDLPTEGWPSMDRYAGELEAALNRLGCEARGFVAARPWPGLRGRTGALVNHAWRSLAYPAIARSQQGEVNHIIDHSYAHLIRALDPRRTVVTCHDVAPLGFDSPGLGFSHALWRRSFEALPQAAHVITSCEFTQAELLKYSRVPAERITVSGYGIGDCFRAAVAPGDIEAARQTLSADDRPVILHVGSCQPRKDVEAILRAMAWLGDLKPVFLQAGGRFSKSQQALVEAIGERATVLQKPAVPDRELALWYQVADLFVFPSLYEGFGLPVLEAMAAGTPVACANAASLPEVSGGAALLFEPRNPQALAGAVRRVLSDGELRQKLIESGKARSSQFTWEKAARTTLEVYESVAALAHPAG
jgi:glycosyltransferase involved in cell wall biosynthesis